MDCGNDCRNLKRASVQFSHDFSKTPELLPNNLFQKDGGAGISPAFSSQQVQRWSTNMI
jgi:hypothetical protein